MKRRFLYRPNEKGEVIPVEIAFREPESRLELITDAAYEGARATDGTDISTRRKHQDYMRANNLSLVSDWTNTWAKAAKERAEAPHSADTKAQRMDAIRRAWDTTKRGR